MNWKRAILGGVILGGMLAAAPRMPAGEGPDFKEIYELLKANGIDEPTLNRATAEGLIKQLSPRVTLVGDTDPASSSSTNTPRLAKVTVLDRSFGYVRFGAIEAGVDKDFAAAWQKLTETNRIKGLLLDLRFADGKDYAAAAAVADHFYFNEGPLLDWGDGRKASTAKDDAIRQPVVILVNARTAAAAEALAATLHHGAVGLLLGSKTAGLATKFKEFTLKTGQRLRLATAEIKFGDNHVLPLTGLQPDIEVKSNLEDEQAYLEDPYKVLRKSSRLASTASTNETTLAGTNRPARRINEAELVRTYRDGLNPEEDGPPLARRISEPGQPPLQDPVLMRALDLLKGLAVVQPLRRK